MIWQHGEDSLSNFLSFINSREPTIKFTIEVEKDNSLPFLDILISKDNNNFRTTVYRKPTNTNRYLNFESNHNISVKTGVVKSLYDRAKTICSDRDSFEKEKLFIKNVLKDNKYPNDFIERSFRKFENRNQNRSENNLDVVNLVIPYIPNISNKIRRLGKNFNIRTIFKTNNTVRSFLTNVKPFNNEQNTKNVVYKIPCHCGKCYIGETSRPVSVRYKEHQDLIRRRDFNKSRIAEHIIDTGHKIDWDNSKILAKETLSSKRKIIESFCIIMNGDKCFSNFSVDINRVWLPLVNKEIERNVFQIE